VKRIYLDHAASTPLHPEAREAMRPWLERNWGNPSSQHAEGREAKEALDVAREIVSGALGCLFAEVLFTSGGTEAAATAILGPALANQDAGRARVLLGAAEHPCVLETRSILARLGYRVERVPVDRNAVVDLGALEGMLGPDVLLVSLMHANNELGTLQPVPEAAELVHRWGALLHTDAVQTFLGAHHGGARWTVADLDADLVTVSGHKVQGPKGVGAMYTRAGIKPVPLLAGGGQEREARAGTENVAAVAGFGAAVTALGNDADGVDRQRAARDLFLDRLDVEGLVESVPDRALLLPGHAHVRIEGIDAEQMLILLDRLGVAASSGAACSSGAVEPSHVLLAAGLDPIAAKQGLRFTFGRTSTLEEASEAADRVGEAARRIRSARG
jgi:cysteine desulfurase